MLVVEQKDAVSIVTLNRPERRNALGTETMRALAATLDAANRDDGTGAIILTGASPAFCAGSDLKELGGLSIGAMCDHEAETAAIARSFAALSKPVVAAVEGYALGGGFILAVSCDVVVTASNARWHLPEVKNGWLPPWGLKALIARTGPVRARLLTWGAEPIDGQEAHRLGVADLLAEPAEALGRALAYASALAAMPRHAVRTTKEFYEPHIADGADQLDRIASRAFGRDCEAPAAQQTLSRFTVRS